MKSLVISMSMMLSLLFVSCSKDDTSITDRDPVGREMTSEEKQNTVLNDNPYAFVGTIHNEVLDRLMCQPFYSTRSVRDSLELLATMKANAYAEYAELEEGTLMRVEDFNDLFDEVMGMSLNATSPSSSISLEKYQMSSQLESCVSEIDNIVDDNDTNIVSLLNRVDSVQSVAMACPMTTGRDVVLSVASIASSSLTYWYDNFQEVYEPLPGLPVEIENIRKWKDACKADYKAGKSVWQLGRAGGVWGWVAVGVIVGAASAVSYYL